MRSVGRWVRLGWLAGGMGLLVFLVWFVGGETILAHAGLIGWGIVPVLCLSAIWKTSNAIAWKLAFPAGKRPSLLLLYVVNLAGDVINNMLPSANLGGELAKPYLLRQDAPVAQSMSAVMANKTMEICAGFIFMTCSVCLALVHLTLEPVLRLGMVLAVLAGSTAVGLLCFVQRRGVFSQLLRAGCRVPFLSRFLIDKQDEIARVDQCLMAFYHQDRGRFLACLGLRLFGWILSVAETHLILHLLGINPPVLTALLLVGLPLIIDTAFFFVPANMGTAEAGHTYVSVLLGFNPAVGLSLSLVKRVRRLFWMGVGGVLLSARLSHTVADAKPVLDDGAGEFVR